jgi:hypothetical protein
VYEISGTWLLEDKDEWNVPGYCYFSGRTKWMKDPEAAEKNDDVSPHST